MGAAKTKVQSDFITSKELAQHLGYASTKQLWRRVLAGHIPRPHSSQGERTHLWRRDHYEHFKETGVWPKACKFYKPSEG